MRKLLFLILFPIILIAQELPVRFECINNNDYEEHTVEMFTAFIAGDDSIRIATKEDTFGIMFEIEMRRIYDYTLRYDIVVSLWFKDLEKTESHIICSGILNLRDKLKFQVIVLSWVTNMKDACNMVRKRFF